MDRNGNSKFNFRFKIGADKWTRTSIYKVNHSFRDIGDIAQELECDYDYELNTLVFGSYNDALVAFVKIRGGFNE